MLLLEWSEEAQLDLIEIVSYIEQHNPVAAQSLRHTIEFTAEWLPAVPYVYRSGRVAGTRECVVHPNYVLVYRVGATHIRVLRILHVRQQYPEESLPNNLIP